MDEEGKKVINPFLEKERFDVDGQKEAMNYPILVGNDSIADNSAASWACPPACSSRATARKSRRSSAWSITMILPRPSRACCSKVLQAISTASSAQSSMLPVAFLRVLSVTFVKAQHRGHKDAQRTTLKSPFSFRRLSSVSLH